MWRTAGSNGEQTQGPGHGSRGRDQPSRIETAVGTGPSDTAGQSSETDPKWQLPEWVASLTDLSDASTASLRERRAFVYYLGATGRGQGPGGGHQASSAPVPGVYGYQALCPPNGSAAGVGVEALLRLAEPSRGAGERPDSQPFGTCRRSRLPRVLSRGELNVILDEPPAPATALTEAVRLRDDAVLELLYGSGLRVSELCGLSMGDVDRAEPVGDRLGQRGQATASAHFRERRRRTAAVVEEKGVRRWRKQGHRPTPSS